MCQFSSTHTLTASLKPCIKNVQRARWLSKIINQYYIFMGSVKKIYVFYQSKRTISPLGLIHIRDHRYRTHKQPAFWIILIATFRSNKNHNTCHVVELLFVLLCCFLSWLSVIHQMKDTSDFRFPASRFKTKWTKRVSILSRKLTNRKLIK